MQDTLIGSKLIACDGRAAATLDRQLAPQLQRHYAEMVSLPLSGPLQLALQKFFTSDGGAQTHRSNDSAGR